MGNATLLRSGCRSSCYRVNNHFFYKVSTCTSDYHLEHKLLSCRNFPHELSPYCYDVSEDGSKIVSQYLDGYLATIDTGEILSVVDAILGLEVRLSSLVLTNISGDVEKGTRQQVDFYTRNFQRNTLLCQIRFRSLLDEIMRSVINSFYSSAKVCHGDMGHSNILMPKDKGLSVKFIDWEYAHFGPAGFDIARFISSLVFHEKVGKGEAINLIEYANRILRSNNILVDIPISELIIFHLLFRTGFGRVERSDIDRIFRVVEAICAAG